MTQNTLVGLLFMFVGTSDLVLARVFGERLNLTPTIRTVLTFGGIGCLAFGALLALGVLMLL